MNKINIADLLRDCPKGMELYSPIFGEVYLDKIRPHLAIVVTTDKEQGDFKEEFLYDGRYGMNGECMLFPSKGKTTWEGFHRPFIEGDIVSTESGMFVGIVKSPKGSHSYHTFCSIDGKGALSIGNILIFRRLATKEEKQELFDAIKANGYKWNAETKTLEKLVEPKFKVGDRIMCICNDFQYDIKELTNTHYTLVEVKDKFKYTVPIVEDKDWELAPNKFDIATLKPFDKVLVRDKNRQEWCISLFSHCNGLEVYKHSCINGSGYAQCIPYNEDTKHLLGTTNDCEDYFKTWEK